MKHPQTAMDYRQHLQDTVNALRLSSEAYDRGYVGEAKRLAVAIRLLLHDTANSISLLQTIGLKETIKYFATPNPYPAGNILTECHLVQIRMGGSSTTYLPVLDELLPHLPWSELVFRDWWTQRVIRDKDRREMSRSDLVLALANKDGGAHVDPKLDAVYADLSRNNSLAWWVGTDSLVTALADGPQFACLRQIAHELEKSLSKCASVAAVGL